MAPPKKPNGPMVRRMIQLDTVDIENVTELRKRLGEQSDAATFRRAVRMALDATSGRVVAPGPAKAVERAEKVARMKVVKQAQAAAFKPHPKPNAGKTSKGRK